MIKIHEIEMITSEFNRANIDNLAIVTNDTIQANDYVLVREIEIKKDIKNYTDRTLLVKVSSVVEDEKLKDKNVLITFKKVD